MINWGLIFVSKPFSIRELFFILIILSSPFFNFYEINKYRDFDSLLINESIGVLEFKNLGKSGYLTKIDDYFYTCSFVPGRFNSCYYKNENLNHEIVNNLIGKNVKVSWIEAKSFFWKNNIRILVSLSFGGDVYRSVFDFKKTLKDRYDFSKSFFLIFLFSIFIYFLMRVFFILKRKK